MLGVTFLIPAVFALLIWNAYRTARLRAAIPGSEGEGASGAEQASEKP